MREFFFQAFAIVITAIVVAAYELIADTPRLAVLNVILAPVAVVTLILLWRAVP